MKVSKIWNYFRSVRDKFFVFLNKNFEMTATKRSKIAGLIVGALTLIFVIFNVEAFTSQEFMEKWLLLAFVLCCPFILGFVTAYNIGIKKDRFDKIFHIVFMFIMPIVTMTMTEALNGVFIYNMTYLGFLGNYIVILIMYFILFALSGSFRVSYLVVNPILFGLALAHSYILDFRGTPFQPMDFLSVTTAAGVANTYDYSPTYKTIPAIMVFIFIIIVGIKIKTPKYKLPTKIISRTVAATFPAVLLLIYFGTDLLVNLGVRPDFWSQSRGYHNYGFVLNFFTNTRFLGNPKPEGYDPDSIKDYIDEVKEEEDKPDIGDNSNKPNIICIMNESLADLKVLGELETNKDYMPFMRKLKKNTIKGNLYVPVIGAGTSNTEFEFLTGHTMAFLPSGSNAYMLYLKKPMASIVSTLKAQGYSTYAMHPYYAVGWKRTEVYSKLGFNDFVSLEDIFIPEVMQEYRDNGSDADYLQQIMDQYYPDEKVLVRQYVSDEYNYKLLIDDFEKRDKSVPYFAFNVTMQNHGGYTTGGINFDESIYATSVSEKYIKADKYLSLVKESDKAFKKLIKYFENVDDPTIICMFGDHQPNVENEFVAEVMGVKNLLGLTPEQEQARHCTPFIIWANYDIEEKEIERLSSNYLSSLVLQTAGVELTEYNKYLLDLAKTLPVIDSVGYIDNEGVHYKWSDNSPYSNLFKGYENLQYNNLSDEQSGNQDVFYLEGYTHEATNIDSILDEESDEETEEEE